MFSDGIQHSILKTVLNLNVSREFFADDLKLSDCYAVYVHILHNSRPLLLRRKDFLTRKLFRAADAAVGKRMTSKSRLLIFLYPPFDARVWRFGRRFGRFLPVGTGRVAGVTRISPGVRSAGMRFKNLMSKKI